MIHEHEYLPVANATEACACGAAQVVLDEETRERRNALTVAFKERCNSTIRERRPTVQRRSASPEMPQAQDRKRSDRDEALSLLHRDRAKRVWGWITWPHTREEIAGIRHFLETGDDSQLPRGDDGRELYPAREGRAML